MQSVPILLAAAALALAAGRAGAGDLHEFVSDDSGFRTRSVWYDDGREVTVVDAQFTTAQAEALLADIRARTRSPVTRVIVTHPNPDKFNGLAVFHRAGASSLASEKTAAAMPAVDRYKRHFFVDVAKMFAPGDYPVLERVRATYRGREVIRLKSGETITLVELPFPGVSSDQTVVRIDRTGDLVVGDLVHGRTHAWLEGGLVDGRPVPDLPGWQRDLAALPGLGRGKVYGGRGEVLPVDEAVREQLAYLDGARAIVDRYVAGLGERAGELADPALQGRHHAALQDAFARAFPSYAMPELVGFSVHGLAAQRLACARPQGPRDDARCGPPAP